MDTLIDLVATAADCYEDRPALVLRSGLRDTTWSYRRLWQAVNAVARHLSEERAIRPGDRVLICAPNSPQFVATFLGTMLSGAIPVPLDTGSTAEFIERVAADTEAAAIITDLPLPPPGLPRYFLADLSYAGGARLFGAQAKAADVAEIIYSSGTTGKPKGVVLTHGNIIANIHSAQATVPDPQPWRLLSLLPLSHMFEQTVGLFVPLLLGATIHYGVSRQSAATRQAMKRYRINVMVVVPKLMTHMLQGIEREVRRNGHGKAWEHAHRLAPYLPLPLRRLLFRAVRRQLGNALDIMLCGGACLPPETELAWERLGVRVIQGYGATECAPLIAGNTLDRRLPGSIGRPAPNIRVRLAEDGEILVKGANVFAGYWRNEAATRAAFTADGWYRTGDLGTLDSHGNLSIRGRKKDMVALPTGMNVFLEDIESILSRQPGVKGCVVLDMPLPNGEIGFTTAVLADHDIPGHPNGQAIAQAAVRSANLQLAPHQRINGFMLWEGEDFPRTAIGKLKRHEVRAELDKTAPGTAQHEDPSLPEPASATAETTPLQRLLGDLSGISAAAITPESDLNLDIGLSSLARVELALLLEETFNVMIEDGDLAKVEKVSQLAALIGQGGSSAPRAEIPLWPLKPFNRWLRSLFQRLLVFPLHRCVARPFSVEGLEHLRDLEQPVLYIANHCSHIDTVSIIRALPGSLRDHLAVAAAADYFFRIPVVGTLTSLLLNTFPFSRQGAVRTSLEHCGFLADQGISVLIYPEGTRSTTGELLPFKLGIGLLATQLHVPVVPIAVFGGRDALPKGRIIPHTAPLGVKFGKPLRFNEKDDPTAVTALLRQQVAELMALPPMASPPSQIVCSGRKQTPLPRKGTLLDEPRID